MLNKVQEGNSLTYTNSTEEKIAGGSLVIVGEFVGIAVADIPAGESGEIYLKGVYRLAKATGTAFAQGDKIYWNATNKNTVKTATDNIFIGYCFNAEVSGATEANIWLKQGD